MLRGEMAKVTWPLRAVTLKRQVVITRCCGKWQASVKPALNFCFVFLFLLLCPVMILELYFRINIKVDNNRIILRRYHVESKVIICQQDSWWMLIIFHLIYNTNLGYEGRVRQVAAVTLGKACDHSLLSRLGIKFCIWRPHLQKCCARPCASHSWLQTHAHGRS